MRARLRPAGGARKVGRTARRTGIGAALAASLALAACGASRTAPPPAGPTGTATTPGAPAPTPPDPGSPAAAPDPAPPPGGEPGEAGFLVPGAVASWPGAGGEVATAVALRAGTHPGFDRVVLELDRLAAYRVAWLDGPPIGCGSGEVADLPGRAFLEARLEPAKAHDEQGALTLQARELRPALPAVGSLALTCDFEAVLTLAAGAPDRLPFRVTRLEAPPRLVIDVRHPGGHAGHR